MQPETKCGNDQEGGGEKRWAANSRRSRDLGLWGDVSLSRGHLGVGLASQPAMIHHPHYHQHHIVLEAYPQKEEKKFFEGFEGKTKLSHNCKGFENKKIPKANLRLAVCQTVFGKHVSSKL